MLLRKLNNSLFKEDQRALEEISSTSSNSRTALEIDTVDHLDEIDVRVLLSGFNLSDKSHYGVVSIFVVGDWDVRAKEVSNGAKSAVTFFEERFRLGLCFWDELCDLLDEAFDLSDSQTVDNFFGGLVFFVHKAEGRQTYEENYDSH